eukprot:COSAG01_NODE_2392_length_7773_cov_9.347928_3_plen_338_part_00
MCVYMYMCKMVGIMHHNLVSVQLFSGLHTPCVCSGATDHGYNGELCIILTCSWCVANFGFCAQTAISRDSRTISELGIEDDALGQLDLLVTEAINQCDMCSITESTVTINRVDTSEFDTAAQELNEFARAESGEDSSEFLCQTVNQVDMVNESKSPLPCCIFGCKKNVPPYVAKTVIAVRLKNNEDLASHDALCEDHHQQLNIDKSVEQLTKKDGKPRPRLTARSKAAKDKRDAKKKKEKEPSLTSQVTALVEALSGSMGASVSAVDATNPADAGTQPVAAPSFSFGAMQVQPTAPAAQQSQTQQVPEAIQQFLRSNPQLTEHGAQAAVSRITTVLS